MTKIKWLVGHIVLDIGVIITNLCEEILMARRWNALDTMDNLLLSLSVSDLVSGLVFLIMDTWILVMVSGTVFDVEKHLVAKRIWDSFCLFSVFGSALHVITIAADRICAIKLPSKYYIFSNFKYKCCMVTLIWVFTLLSTATVSVFSIYTEEVYVGLITRGWSLAAATALVFIMYFIVMCTYCQKRTYTTNDFRENANLHYKVLKPFTLIAFLLGMNYIVCVSPITYSYFHPMMFHPIGDVMFTLKSILNPWIYFTKILFKSRYFNRIRPDGFLQTRDTTLESRNTTTTDHFQTRATITRDDLYRAELDSNDNENAALV